jgi:hypothetical protein
MAKIFLLTGVVLTFAIGTVAATETGLLMPMPASLAGGQN